MMLRSRIYWLDSPKVRIAVLALSVFAAIC